jgi:L-fucono-1,5-lactonase
VIVDAHQHFWRLDRGDYGWLQPNLGVLYRDYLPRDLAPLLKASNVDATVLVQAAATESETRYLLELGAECPFVSGVVGWVDFERVDAPQRIAAMVAAGNGLLKGLRPMMQDIVDPDWVVRPQLDPAFNAMVEHGLSFDALVKPHHLSALRKRLHQHPDLRIVIDHAGKPNIAGNAFSPWAEVMASLAQETAARCKLSGLLTEAGGDAGVEKLDSYAAHVFACFGPKRVMWGSDWPVLNSVCDYDRWLALARDLVARHAPGNEAAVFGGNAIAFYSLESSK